MSNQAIWQVQKCEGSDYLVEILKFLLPEYIRIFGKEVMLNAPCIVYNDTNAKCPRFNHTEPLTIRLHQKSLSFWAQTIFQLSHEMCHYAMYQTKKDKDQTLSWFEEIVCEAMSLYALEYAAKNWNKCSLYRISPDFGKHIQEYLDNELKCTALDGFAQCTTVPKLKNYESGKYPENDRTSHVTERNKIYTAISQNPTEVSCFLHYQWYIQPEDGVTFDFISWHRDDPKNLILQILSIYPIKGKEKLQCLNKHHP